MGCKESRARKVLEIGILRFHVIKVIFKETYHLMRAASEQRALSEWGIFSVGNDKGEGLQPSGA